MGMGRPKEEDPRVFRHSFRFNSKEEILFQCKLKKLKNKEKSERIRAWIMDGIKNDC